MSNTYRAHIFKQRQEGPREEVKIKLFTTEGESIDLGNTGGDSEPGGPDIPENLAEHVNSETPHPVYDDGPSFDLLYQNAKV